MFVINGEFHEIREITNIQETLELPVIDVNRVYTSVHFGYDGSYIKQKRVQLRTSKLFWKIMIRWRLHMNSTYPKVPMTRVEM